VVEYGVISTVESTARRTSMDQETVFAYGISPQSVYITRDPANPSVAKLDIGVSNNTGSDVACAWISLVVRIGPEGSDLTEDAAISPSVSQPAKWSIAPIPGAPGQFRAAPIPPNTGLKARESIGFQLANIVVNEELGLTGVRAIELTDDRRERTVDVNKIRSELNIDYFRSSPADIPPGGASTLSWKTQAAASCRLSWSGQAENVPVTSSKEVQPPETTIYTLTAHGGVGPDISAQTAVIVTRVRILAFDGPLAPVVEGDKALLSWRTQNAVKCQLYADGVPINLNAPLQSDGYPVEPKKNPTLYELHASGQDGSRERNPLTVYVFKMKLSLAGSIAMPENSYPGAIAVSPDYFRLFVTGVFGGNFGAPGALSVVDLATRAVTKRIVVGANPTAVALTANGARAYVANAGSHTVSVIDTASLEVVRTVGVGRNPSGVAVTPDGSKVFTANLQDNSVSVIDTSDYSVTAIPVEKNPKGVAVSLQGTRAYVANGGSGTASVIDASRDAVIQSTGVQSFPWGVAVLQDGSRAYVSNLASNSISVIDTADYRVVAAPGVDSAPWGVVVPPYGPRVYYVMSRGAGSVSGLYASSNQVVSTIKVGTLLFGIAVSPGGDMLYVSQGQGVNNNFIFIIETGRDQPRRSRRLPLDPAGL
jgi:YVTN family beta-propeller protein